VENEKAKDSKNEQWWQDLKVRCLSMSWEHRERLAVTLLLSLGLEDKLVEEVTLHLYRSRYPQSGL
jgi:hypothetical protein